MAHEAVELDERARVEQLLHPLRARAASPGSVLLDGLLASRMPGLLAQLLSRSSLPWVDSVRSSVAATRVS